MDFRLIFLLVSRKLIIYVRSWSDDTPEFYDDEGYEEKSGDWIGTNSLIY